ncbi:MAG: hypothetical protein ACOX2S_09760 [bacterium]|jgi:hypothetical protein
MADIDQLAQALQKINTGEISGGEARLNSRKHRPGGAFLGRAAAD